MPSQTIQTMPFTQIIAFKSYLCNLGKPLNSTLKLIHITLLFPVMDNTATRGSSEITVPLVVRSYADPLCYISSFLDEGA